MSLLICLFGATAAVSADKRTYWPGFTGQISQIMVPVEIALPQDRFLTLKISVETSPRASDVAFDNAFRAVCKWHQGELRKLAGKLSRYNDWRVRVVFRLPAGAATNGVTVQQFRSQMLWLSNCRFQ
ncbi:MAG: hypothetical protein AB8B60_10960 [Sulfitobacter sp.]